MWKRVVLISGLWMTCGAQTTNVVVTPGADAFVRSLAPGANYGGAGAISVSGSAAVNGSAQQNGLFDSLLRFPMSNVVTTADSAFGAHDWVITRATLHLTELGAPANSLFNRGVGAFEIRWINSDNWIEGTGNPNMPTTNGIVYTNLPSLLNPVVDVSLGQFTNSGADGLVSFNLALASSLVADVKSGGDVTLYMTAASPSVGFTADSRSFMTASAWPSLEFAIANNPRPVLSIRLQQQNQVAVGFNAVSNWTYVLQAAPALSSFWSNLYTRPSQPTNGASLFVEDATSGSKVYRVLALP